MCSKDPDCTQNIRLNESSAHDWTVDRFIFSRRFCCWHLIRAPVQSTHSHTHFNISVQYIIHSLCSCAAPLMLMYSSCSDYNFLIHFLLLLHFFFSRHATQRHIAIETHLLCGTHQVYILIEYVQGLQVHVPYHLYIFSETNPERRRAKRLSLFDEQNYFAFLHIFRDTSFFDNFNYERKTSFFFPQISALLLSFCWHGRRLCANLLTLLFIISTTCICMHTHTGWRRDWIVVCFFTFIPLSLCVSLLFDVRRNRSDRPLVVCCSADDQK